MNYTNTIKNKDHKKINIDNLKARNDELGLLSKSLDDMTLDLQKRIITSLITFPFVMYFIIMGGNYIRIIELNIMIFSSLLLKFRIELQSSRD